METKDLFNQYVVPSYARQAVSFVKGEGSWLIDEQGDRYLDFASGVAVVSLGHSNPAISSVIAEQSATLMHCSNLFLNPKQAELAKMLTEVVMHTPGKAFFCNSGAEANEALIKLSRKFFRKQGKTGTPEIITFNNSFHGRTMAGISATAQPKVKTDFEPLLENFIHIDLNDLNALTKAITPQTCAVMLETIQGEGGVNTATQDFLLGLNKICREKNILLLVDEVQAGIGRAGYMTSWEGIVSSADFQPDAVSWAKGLGGGFPIGAAWISSKKYFDQPLSDFLSAGSHGSTFGGNPLACSVAIAVLNEMNRTELIQKVREKGEYARERLSRLPIKSVKGLGLLLGIELNPEVIKNIKGYDAALSNSANLVRALTANKLLTVAAGNEVLRFIPPLTVSREEIDLAIEIIYSVLNG